MSNYSKLSEKAKKSHRKASQAWILKNQEKQASMMKQRLVKMQAWFRDLKKGLVCSICRENDWRCLDFDHIDPKTKLVSVSKAVTGRWSKEKILEEITKCQILCANCHRKKTLSSI